ncbi:tudor domain-containing protein 5 isoform X1 [Mastomys coucha]|uniref:tudor domain-containing protein 5 isoform X1 n=1 Tax=Mastomys coucha TaxID=35658 RepID=UPI0012624BF7|nr:tudor domain-containing protein 5 isoform X1 [Mastomys coucha]XP_031241454.1 tudor domain-containing protein 5 isoform X1 [Mastomys coucha]XP_031241462.1 tudor domain-containing protein 5 isoform X1 [Mastomys coucha]
MSEQERIQDCLRKEIRSLLISTKDGLTPQQLEKEYLLMVGNHLPLRILGYRSTMELVLDMPDVVSVSPCGDGTVILKAIPDESTKGIASLVAKQRRSHKVRNPVQKGRSSVCSGRVPYRGRVPPILPAVVKSELKDLLALSPVLLSDFEKAFAKRFGRSFQYMQYGFLSMFEVLNAASDVISVEQTRAGSLLTLKKSVIEDKHRGWPAGKIFTQPFRMKQQGSYSAGFPVTKTRFSQSTSNMEPPKQVLSMEKMPAFHAVEASRLNHTEKLNQLESTFKSVIAQIGPGGTVDPDLKHKIKFVVSKFPQGLFISKLLGEFELIFKEQLSPKQLGFLNVTELVGALSDILRVEFSEEKQDLLVFDADLKPLPPGQSLSSVRNSCLVQPDKKTEANAWASSLSRNSLSTIAVKKITWDCPLKNHKEPEQKLYKKPNLVVKPLQLQMETNKAQLSLPVASHDIPPDAVRARKLCRLPPLDTSTLVGVFVEYIISPSQFYIRIYSRDSSELLEDMMIEMRRCYSNQMVSDRYIMPEYFIQPGHLCCVRISEDKWWYRVIIHRILGKKEVEVFYPDFGNIGTVQKSSLRFLKCCYTKLPAQAIPCSLAWVRPAEEHWTSRAILHFQKLCGLKPLVGVVDEYIDGILNIFLCDTSSNEDVYFHHVLRTEGHAIVCRENAPSKGFRDLNPPALYTNSSSAGDMVLTELGHPAHQHYLNEDREMLQQPQQDIHDEKSVSHLNSAPKELLKDSKLSSLKTHKSCEEDPQWSSLQPKDLKEENEDEVPTGMPCLESVTIGDDVWDENWLPLQAKMGKTGSPASHLFTSSLVGKKQYQTRGEMTQKDWCFSTSKDIWDDSWQPLGLASDVKGGIHTPEGPTAQEKNNSTTRNQQQPDLQYPLDSSTLPKLEEFYMSLIKSQQSAEGSQAEPASTQTQRASSTAPSSSPADSAENHSGSVESSPGSLKNEDVSNSPEDSVGKDKSQGAIDQLSFILSPQHQISQKLYIPRSTATAVLGAAARLATSRSLLHWYPSVKGGKLEGQEVEGDGVK